MKFYIQKEKDISLNISVQTDEDQGFQLVPETPHLIESSHQKIYIHVPDFQHAIHGNNESARNNGIYLIGLEANGDLTIEDVGQDTTEIHNRGHKL